MGSSENPFAGLILPEPRFQTTSCMTQAAQSIKIPVSDDL
ncbi:hypothetical protein HMPREF3156_02609 [Neisseria sp. HMSC06F02]|nr:hypothetical protein HMPREF3156_02609 [Neisseria sp. HMSC06F02]